MDLDRFIESFSDGDVDCLRFAWNGEHGENLRDPNLELRRQVVDRVLTEPNSASSELLRVLFEAETECAKEAWGVRRDLHLLAGALLKAGGRSTVKTFLIGRSMSMDTYIECSQIRIDTSLASDLAGYCREWLEDCDTEAETKLAQGGASLFESTATHEGDD
ncbi:MAG: hypothetical protein AAF196_18685 [Planctomycetota bacterium]